MWFAAITANSDPTRGGTHDDVRRRATAVQHHPSTSSMGEGGEVAEACSGVHVDGHATVANAAVIPRGFVGRQSVTDFSVVQDALPAARLAQTHAHTHARTLRLHTGPRYRHNGARQLHSVGRSPYFFFFFCTGGGVYEERRATCALPSSIAQTHAHTPRKKHASETRTHQRS